MKNQQISSALTGHVIVSTQEWLEARKQLLTAEKELTRQNDINCCWCISVYRR